MTNTADLDLQPAFEQKELVIGSIAMLEREFVEQRKNKVETLKLALNK